MRQRNRVWRAAAIAMFVAALVLGMTQSAAAQGGDATIKGQILDRDAKPWPNMGVTVVGEQGQKFEAKTDNEGRFTFRNLRSGVYTISVLLPNQAPYEVQLRVPGGQETPAIINFKEIIAKAGAAAQEEMKKQAEESKKFEGLKAHFTAGNGLLEQVRQARNELLRAPSDQKDALKQKIADLTSQAINEFQSAQKSASEKDPNQHLLWAKLGESYEAAGRNDDAGNAYQQAISLKPDVAGYYNNYGNVLARQGKVEDAGKAYAKSAELDPANAASAWRNFGIVLENVGKMKEAVEPLKKSSEIDPKSAQTWYLLGVALVGAMDYKTEGDKVIPIILPGTIEAYEKAIELDPNGPAGKQAKEGLEQLKAMGVGIETKVSTKKKR